MKNEENYFSEKCYVLDSQMHVSSWHKQNPGEILEGTSESFLGQNTRLHLVPMLKSRLNRQGTKRNQ